MTTVRDFMSTELTILSPRDDVLRAMQTLIEGGISGAPVVDEQGSLVGLLTQRDCLTVAFRSAYHGGAAGRVEEFMTREVETVDVGTTLVEVIARFYHSSRRRFPVLDENRLVGQISRRDVLRAFLELI
ncbi:MAG: CBS domain-containing protein [Myxococcota bacterium]